MDAISDQIGIQEGLELCVSHLVELKLDSIYVLSGGVITHEIARVGDFILLDAIGSREYSSCA